MTTIGASSVSGIDCSTEPRRDGFFKHHGIMAPGVRLFRNLRFASKALIIYASLTLPTLALVGWLLLSGFSETMQEKIDATRKHVEVARGVVSWAQAQEASGALTREAAQQLAAATIGTLRYDKTEYFWINDMDAKMVMHPVEKELDGTYVGDMKDPHGFALFRAFIDTVRKEGEGAVKYQWPRPGAAEPVDKVSYVIGFKPWGWVIGSGVYVDDVRREAVRRATVVGAVLLMSFAIAGYLFFSFYRVMDGGLKETSRHLHAMTEGDLTTSPEPWGRDEAAQLMLELRDMQDSLRQMVQRVRASSSEIVHSSGEIATGAMDLSSRTEQSAANLEESSASMEQLAATVKNSAAHTQEALEVARENASQAEAGGHVMHEVVETMEGIRASSSKIADIIGTIDGIAFQTNILALNAAVEAARAGEQGRGFAVVASEVRTLAQRSAEAAREIKQLINSSVESIESGAEIVRRAGETIGSIVDSSRRVDTLLNEVATGAREQSLGIEQVSQAVSELDRATQQNAALVEETAAASSAMRDQAVALSQEVERFKLPVGANVARSVARGTDKPFDFDAAIEAHRHWKVKLRQAISEQSQLDAEKVCRDDACPLGLWLHGDGRRRYSSKPNFVALVNKHAEFHEAAGAVARLINARKYQEAEQGIGAGSNFQRVSTDVTGMLTSARRGL